MPLNEFGKDIYLRGLIPDRKLPESLICEVGEKASMILFFAMYLRKPYRAKEAGQKYSLLLTRCIEHHIKIIARSHGEEGAKIDVWVQSEDQSIRDHYIYRGFERTELTSSEGYPFYRRHIVVS